MSNSICEHCGLVCIDLPAIGYLTGCEHYPPDCRCHDRVVTKCDLCVMRERLEEGEKLSAVLDDYGI